MVYVNDCEAVWLPLVTRYVRAQEPVCDSMPVKVRLLALNPMKDGRPKTEYT